MGQRIRQRRATAAQWTTANPVLEAGEFGWESDTNRLKIGNGATAWNALSYFGAGLVEGTPLRQNMANNLTFTQAHGLGQVPKIVQMWIECIVANNGYSIGDIAQVVSTTATLSYNSTTLQISRASTTVATQVHPKAGGAVVTVLLANWRWYVRAFA